MSFNCPPEIHRMAQARVLALLPESQYGDLSKAQARIDELTEALVKRGTSAVALEELRLLQEALDSIDADLEAEQRAEIAAENAWLHHAERSTPDDEAFEQYEARLGLAS